MVERPTDATDRTGCTHFVLARGVVGHVEYCASCAVFHVTLDSLSIRFRATALRDLRDTLSAALAAYEEAQRMVEARERLGPDGMH